jgi:hypothetical protein
VIVALQTDRGGSETSTEFYSRALVWAPSSVPEGSHEDHMRDPRMLNNIARTLREAGAIELPLRDSAAVC